MRKSNIKYIGITILIVVVGILVFNYMNQQHIPLVTISSHGETNLTILKGNTQSIRVIVNNAENSTINDIMLKTEIKNQDPKNIQILTESIDVGSLNAHQNSGDKYIQFRALDSSGGGIDYPGTIKVLVGETVTNELPFLVRVELPP